VSGFEPGPGLRLSQARQELRAAVLTLELALAKDGETVPLWDHITAMARELDRAQEAWDEAWDEYVAAHLQDRGQT
jgi:hypothetical protein